MNATEIKPRKELTVGYFSFLLLILSSLTSSVIEMGVGIPLILLIGEENFKLLVIPFYVIISLVALSVVFKVLCMRYVATVPTEVPECFTGISVSIAIIFFVFQGAFSPQTFLTLQTTISLLVSISSILLCFVLLKKLIAQDNLIHPKPKEVA